MSSKTVEIVYTWQDGREEVKYRRPHDSKDGRKFMREIDEMAARLAFAGITCPYSYRLAPVTQPTTTTKGE